MVKLWLDDIRVPPDESWTWCKTANEAKLILLAGNVEEASLDHDLGACEKCLKGMDAEEWLWRHDMKSIPNCEHYGTGYTLVSWMEENHVWPKTRPKVHSANPVGRRRMEMVIDKWY